MMAEINENMLEEIRGDLSESEKLTKNQQFIDVFAPKR